MRLNNLGYLLKEGFRGIFLHGFMSFAAICVTIACLLIVGSFSILAYNLDVMVEDLNQTSEIMVYIDTSLSNPPSSPGRRRCRTLSATTTTTPPSTASRPRTCATVTWSPWKTTP